MSDSASHFQPIDQYAKSRDGHTGDNSDDHDRDHQFDERESVTCCKLPSHKTPLATGFSDGTPGPFGPWAPCRQSNKHLSCPVNSSQTPTRPDHNSGSIKELWGLAQSPMPAFALRSGGVTILNIDRRPYVYRQELSTTLSVALTKVRSSVHYMMGKNTRSASD